MTTRTCLRQSMEHGTSRFLPISCARRPVAQTERNARGPVSAHNLFVLPSGGVPPDKLQRTFLCGRRLNDVATIVPMRQFKAGHSTIPAMTPCHRLAEVAKPPILAQHLAVFAHGHALDLLVKSPRRPPTNFRGPRGPACCALCRPLAEFPLASTARRRDVSAGCHRSSAAVTLAAASAAASAADSGLVFFESSLGLYYKSTSRPAHPPRSSSTLSLVRHRCTVRRCVVWLAEQTCPSR